MVLDAFGNLDFLIPRQVRVAEHDDVGVREHVSGPGRATRGGTAVADEGDAVSVDPDEGGLREFEIHVVVSLHGRHRCVTGE